MYAGSSPPEKNCVYALVFNETDKIQDIMRTLVFCIILIKSSFNGEQQIVTVPNIAILPGAG